MFKMTDIIEEPFFRKKISVFDDRIHAGELLSEKLERYRDQRSAYVLAIPAGGVQVAFIVSKRLRIPLDLAIIFLVLLKGRSLDISS